MPQIVDDATAARVVEAAKQQIGQRYVWGGDSRAEGGFDCSGLVQAACAQVGIPMPRVADDQQAVCPRTEHPRPGDLVFYGHPAYHVGIYAGGGMMVVAPHTGGFVEIERVYEPVANYGQLPARGRGAGIGRLLRRGDRGNDVAVVQRALHLTVDGVFGPLTDTAVRSWQDGHGITRDGVVGPQTARSLGLTWAA